MTMPHLMNCEHSSDGWCLDCVKEMYDEQTITTVQLRDLASLFAGFLGHTEGLFGMELANEGWSDGSDYCFFPKTKRLSDFTPKECIETLYHIHEWLAKNNKHTKAYWGN